MGQVKEQAKAVKELSEVIKLKKLALEVKYGPSIKDKWKTSPQRRTVSEIETELEII